MNENIYDEENQEEPYRSKLPEGYLKSTFQVSKPAAALWRRLKDELGEADWFHYQASHSLVMEWLLWCYRKARAEGFHFPIEEFEPKTRRPGRPNEQFTRSRPYLRPSHIRKLAGVDSKTARRKL